MKCTIPILALCGVLFLASVLRSQDIFERFLYVATPGIRNDLSWGGHGVLVFDLDREHKFVKRIPFHGLNEKGEPRNVKGVCADVASHRLFVATTHTLSAIDLVSEKELWEIAYEGGCDRMSISTDGKVIYLPSFEKDFWNVVDAANGKVIKRIETPNTGSHNTVVGHSGRNAYLAGLRSPMLRVVDTGTQEVIRQVGPFSASIRPFTVNGKGTLCFVNVNELLGFEVGDLLSGAKLHRVEVEGFNKGPVKRHGCPSHGIGITPDEKEIWVCDAHNQRMHYFDATVMPPKQIGSIVCRDDPGWITFSIDGKYAYPSSGEVVDVVTHKVIATLEDEQGRHVASEKMLEIDFRNGKPFQRGDQFGLGRSE